MRLFSGTWISIVSGISKYLVLLGIFSIFTACYSEPATPSQVSLEVETEDFFQELIDQEKFQTALSELFLRENEISNDLYNTYKDHILSQLSARFSTLLVQGDDLEILKTYVTLQNIDINDVDMPDENSIRFHQLLSCLDNGYFAAASVLLMKGIDLESISTDHLRYLEEKFYQGSQKDSLRVVADEIDRRNMDVTDETRSLVLQEDRKSDLVNGTVTLWVDKGLRTENGMGIPDRMIGSGFFIDNQGYLITNYHVISTEVDPKYEGYSRLYIKRDDLDGEKIPAKVIGWDPVMDLALIKTEMTVPYNFSFAKEYDLELGDSIFAIGSPGGLEKTMTTGSISSQSRNIQALGFSIQVDVPINPGNSGGPLLNQNGKVIGVVYSGIESFEGVNFAIPGGYVKELLPRLYRGGKVEYSWIGAALFKDMNHLEIAYTFPGSPARIVGFESGDIIRKVNDRDVSSTTDVQDIFFGIPPGAVVSIEIERNGSDMEIAVPLVKRPDIPIMDAYGNDARENLLLPVFGMSVIPMDSRRTKSWYRVESVYPGSIADESGIIKNDTIRLDKWEVYQDQGIILLQIILRAQSRGYIESPIQIGSWLNMNHFI